MKKKFLAKLAMGVLLLGTTTMANANLITNGSFEAGSFVADANNSMSYQGARLNLLAGPC